MNNLIENEGIIEITKIENIGNNADQIGTLKARFVRYPGCQQLSVWLPEFGGHGYGTLRIVDARTETLIEEQAVSDKISGSVLMTWDTLEWSSTTYRLDIEHPKGGKHCLYFNKLEEGEIVPKDKIVEMPTASADSPSLAIDLLPKEEPEFIEGDTLWKVYRDGFGNPIPNEDRAIRDRAMNEIKNIFSKIKDDTAPCLEYEDQGRGGYVTYVEGSLRIRLWHEIGGGDCKWYIETPTETKWENETKTPLSRRREILLFIANGVRRDQCPSWRFEIRDREIAYFEP